MTTERRSALVSLFRRVALRTSRVRGQAGTTPVGDEPLAERIARTTADAEQWITGLEQRAAEATRQTEATVAGIAQQAAETCTQAEVTVAALAERVASAATYGQQWASYGEQWTAYGEQWLAGLQERAAEATEQIEATMAGVTHRAAATTTQAEETLEGLERRSLDAIARSQESVTDLTDRAAETIKQLEHSVERLKQRATETTIEADHAVTGLTTLAAESITNVERRLQERVTETTTGAEHTLTALTTRAAEAITDVERRVQERVTETTAGAEHALTGLTTRAAEAITDVERRVQERVAETTTGAERAITVLTTRTAEAINDLERQVKERAIETTAGAEHALAGLTTRTAEAITDLERRMKDRATETTTEADVALTGITNRAAEAITDLERRVSMFASHQHAIEHALAQGARAADVADALSAIEDRIWVLVGQDKTLKRAENRLDHIERRAGEADARLAEVTRAKDKLALELAALHRQLMPTEADRDDVTAVSAPVTRSRSVGGSVIPAKWRHAATTRGPVWSGAAIVGAIALLGLTAVPAIRSLSRQSLADGGQRPTERQAAPRSSARVPPETQGIPGPSATIAPAIAVRPAAPTEPLSPNAPVVAAATLRPAGVPAAASRLTRASSQGPRFAGTLAVQSVPGGAVFVDQRPAGQTPIHLTGVRAGSHVIRIEREGYERWSAAVTVADGEETRVAAKLQLAARPDPLSPKAPVVAAAALRPAGVPSAALGTLPPATTIANEYGTGPRLAPVSTEGPQFAGTLAVQSVPGGVVFVNQRRAGQTPIRLPRVRAGSHVVRIEREGYQSWTAAVMVSDGKETRVAATLQSARRAH
jgi:hypothetical protein